MRGSNNNSNAGMTMLVGFSVFLSLTAVIAVAAHWPDPSGSKTVTIYPGKTATYITHATIGTRRGLAAGTYRLYLTYMARSGTWKATPFAFRQPY